MEAHNELCKLNGTEMCNSTWHSRCHPQPRPTNGSFSTDHCTLAPRLDRLMRVLVHSGFFAQQKLLHNSEEEEGYSLTFASQFLLKDEFFSGVPLLLLQLDLILAAPWHFLGDWFQNEDPTPFHTARRKSFWDYAIHEPKLNDIFNETMVSDPRLIANMFVRQYKEVFEGLTSLVDVEVGIGTMPKAIAKAFPQLKCIVFDQPHVVSNLEVGENLEIVGGNIFEAIPPADAILLKEYGLNLPFVSFVEKTL